MVSAGKTRGPADVDEFSASNRDIAARSRYKHLRRRACGGDRSDIEKRIPLLSES